MKLSATLRGKTFTFQGVRDVLAKANEEKSGDRLAGVAAESAFPLDVDILTDIAVDEEGTLYVSDSGRHVKGGGAIYRIDLKGKVSLITNVLHTRDLYGPTGVVMDGMSHVLVVDRDNGNLQRIKIADKTSVKLADGFADGGSLTWDYFGRLYISDLVGGRVSVIPRPGEKPICKDSGRL